MIPLPSPDALSRIMIGLGCFLLLPVLFCGGTPFRGGRKYLILGLFCVASCLAPLASTWFGFVLWVELASIALVLLIASRDPFAAKLYLYVQLAAGGILLLGAAQISTLPLLAPLGEVPKGVLPFFLVGLGIKSAFPLLHFWLPRTYEHAPLEALLLSSYTATMGIYGLLRLVTDPSPGLLLTGTAMALYGAFQALMQSRPRRILAYSTMSQLGFVVTALATGTPSGRDAAIFFAVVHVLSKGLLFCSTENILPPFIMRSIFRNAPDYSGSLFFFTLGALTMAGFPGTAGYLAKDGVLTALGSPWALHALQLAGAGTMLYLCKLGYGVFYAPFCPEMPSKGSKETKQSFVPSFSFPVSMILFAFPLLFLRISPESTLSLSFASKTFWSWSALTGSLLLLGGVLAFFLLVLRRIPTFQSCSFPDVDLLVYRLVPLGKGGMHNLRKIHSGKLRLSFTIFAFALLGIFLLFSL